MSNKALGIIVGGAVIFVGAIIALMMLVAKIDEGNVGVVYSVNGGVKEETLAPGWHITGITDKVIEYPVRTQNKEYEGLASATRDGKSISLPISLNYLIDPAKASSVYKKFGSTSIEDLEDGYIKTRINDALRQTVSNYTVIETFGEKAGEIKTETLERAKEDLGSIGIIVEDVMISAPQPDEQTQAAIDDRVAASQELERAEIDRQKAEKEAERKEIEANGEATANKILQESLSDEVLQQQLIQKWSGENILSIGDSSGVIVDLPAPKNNSEE